MSRIVACLAALLFATATGPALTLAHHHDDAERPPEHELRFDVETDRLVYRPHDPMAITVSVHNPNPEPVRLTFPTTHQAGYVMDGRYDWSHDKFFLMILTHVESPLAAHSPGAFGTTGTPTPPAAPAPSSATWSARATPRPSTSASSTSTITTTTSRRAAT